MGLQLNIKDPVTVGLARSLAADLRTSVTEAVRQALEEKTRRREDEVAVKVREAMAIIKGARDLWGPEVAGKTSKEIMDSIYDDDGLPV